mmetsp:Transcript_89319/g.252703  ORF Transcript_89319/g.252703 Transcript_89319/m.252703 type:complete len:300 (-) Transcript_89319:1-900(-)
MVREPAAHLREAPAGVADDVLVPHGHLEALVAKRLGDHARQQLAEGRGADAVERLLGGGRLQRQGQVVVAHPGLLRVLPAAAAATAAQTAREESQRHRQGHRGEPRQYRQARPQPDRPAAAQLAIPPLDPEGQPRNRLDGVVARDVLELELLAALRALVDAMHKERVELAHDAEEAHGNGARVAPWAASGVLELGRDLIGAFPVLLIRTPDVHPLVNGCPPHACVAPAVHERLEAVPHTLQQRMLLLGVHHTRGSQGWEPIFEDDWFHHARHLFERDAIALRGAPFQVLSSWVPCPSEI